MTAPDTVLVAGSLHYDIVVEAEHLPRRDETAVGSRWYPKCGGKGGNQAAAVVRAGARARFLGAVGEDDFGIHLRRGLRAAGVEDSFVATLSGVGSGMSVAIMEPSGDYAATIVSGANLQIPIGPLEGEELWHAVGLLVLQNEVTEAFNLAVAQAARARGLRCLLNAAPSRAMSPDLCGLVDVLVVNAVEAEMMGAGPVISLTTARDAARTLASRFETVVVTAGGLGLAARSSDGRSFEIPAEPVDVVSTHGAGDAFTGQFAASLLFGKSFEDCCREATRAAAQHVAGSGPSPSG